MNHELIRWDVWFAVRATIINHYRPVWCFSRPVSLPEHFT